jgi:hypothetical protein
MCRLSPLCFLLLALGCGEDKTGGPAADASPGTTDGTDGDDGGPCDPAADTDGDGLDDCTEDELGTEAALADTDGDGISDGEELDCVSDPLDADERCYACGWQHNDPGTLEATGAEVGDTIENLVMVDQCGESVALWDFAGSYTVAFLTAAWCPQCKEEAGALSASAAALADETGEPVQGVIVLFESRTAGAPTAEDAPPYAEEIGAETTPVLADTGVAALAATPYDGTSLPGVCLLAPDMTILACGAGPGQLEGLASTISAHAD